MGARPVPRGLLENGYATRRVPSRPDGRPGPSGRPYRVRTSVEGRTQVADRPLAATAGIGGRRGGDDGAARRAHRPQRGEPEHGRLDAAHPAGQIRDALVHDVSLAGRELGCVHGLERGGEPLVHGARDPILGVVGGVGADDEGHPFAARPPRRQEPTPPVAGGLRGAAVEVVRCKTSDLEVPATAEIIMEGEIPAGVREEEGPFGEYPGYYGGSKSAKHTIRVECITHRDDPIFHGCLTGASPGRTNEGTTWTPATFSAMAWHYLEQAGVPNITGVWRGKWPETMRVQIRKSHRGHAQQVANALWGSHLGNYAAKHLIVVDDDIDIHDWEAIEWALCYRVNAALGDISFFSGTSGSMLDPSVPLEERNSVKYGHGHWARVLIDATINWRLEPQEQYGGERYPPLGTVAPPGMADQIQRRWEEDGV